MYRNDQSVTNLMIVIFHNNPRPLTSYFIKNIEIFLLVKPGKIPLEDSTKFRFRVINVQPHNSKKFITYYSVKILPH